MSNRSKRAYVRTGGKWELQKHQGWEVVHIIKPSFCGCTVKGTCINTSSAIALSSECTIGIHSLLKIDKLEESADQNTFQTMTDHYATNA